MRSKRLIILVIAILFILTGCSNKQNQTNIDNLYEHFMSKADEVIIEDDTITFTDAAMQSHSLSSGFKRPISLYSSYSTLWYESGGTLVGTIGGKTAVELYMEYIGYDITKEVSVLSTYSVASKWSIELILASNPDLIICSTAMSGYDTIKSSASELKIPVIAVDYENFSDYLKWFKVFAFLNNRMDLYQNIALKALDGVIEVIEEAKKIGTSPRVLSLFSGPESILANTNQTLIGSMLDELNATNIITSLTNSSAERIDVNLESIVNNQPDQIIVSCHTSNEEAQGYIERAYGDNPLWNYLDAVKNARIAYLPKTLFHNKPNSRFLESYQMLASILYPEHRFSFQI